MRNETEKEVWTSIAARKDTKQRLFDMKKLKAAGKLENYDDVIRRGMNMPEIADESNSAGDAQ
jgi:hypothetical protein